VNKTKTKFQKGAVLDVLISKMAFGGQGIARMATEEGELVVFVPNTIPGQQVRCRVEKSRKNHLETRLEEVLVASPDEVMVDFQPIAGAPYITLPIALQEQYKRDTTADLFRRIGGIRDAADRFDAFISSPSHFHYRNKMEYAFAAIRYDLNSKEELDDFALGFKRRGTWWIVENLDADSGLLDAQVESNLHLIRKFCIASGLPPWHAPRREGFFRFLTVRKSYAENTLLFNLVTTSKELKSFDMAGFVALMKSLFAERLAGIIHTINDETGDRTQPNVGSSRLIFGADHITEVVHGMPFKISMQSFFQTNPQCAALLYSKAIDYLSENVEDGGIVLDLFCGTGTISQLVANRLTGSTVIGVDIEAAAIDDARKSSEGRGNIRFFAADAGKFLHEHPEYIGKINAIVMDPPRAGIAPKTLVRVMNLGAPAIVYISCNPATLARDTNTLEAAGYSLVKYSLVDQFPHTAHVEAVSVFRKKH
jgi:23S rRNA (uracil-5-)-methyltransferase RumA